MKKILTVILVLLTAFAYGQQLDYSNKKFPNGFAVGDGATNKPTSGLTAGALWFNTVSGMQYYNGSAWVTFGVSSAGVTLFNTRAGAVVPIVGDYSAFYPLLNGTGATGTWGIGITGNAGTVTNGVYTVGNQTIGGFKSLSEELSLLNGNGLIFNNFNNTIKTSLYANFAATNKIINLPPNSGVLALTSDLTGGTVTSVGGIAGTGISIVGSPITSSGSLTITNTAPDQTVALTAGTGISTSGTYPNFTITNTSPSSGGTVTSITPAYGFTSAVPITTSGTLTVDSTKVQTVLNFFPKGDTRYARTGSTGTVTSVAALTLGTTGTDLNSTVANGTTTPVITLNVPDASATARGALSAADWSTFNAKQPAGSYEPAFAKNTGFNKNFGSIAGTVLEGRTFGTAANNTTGDFYATGSTVANSTLWGGASYGGPYLPLTGGALIDNLVIQRTGNSNLRITSNGVVSGYISANPSGFTEISSDTGGLRFSVNGLGGTARYTIDASGNNTFANLAGIGTRMVVADPTGLISTQSIPGGGGGSVTGVNVASANGLAGTSDGAAVVPTLTLRTTVSGMVKGNGTALSAAMAGTDYVIPSGSVATLTTPRTIWGQNFNGSANVSGTLTGVTDITSTGTYNGRFGRFINPGSNPTTGIYVNGNDVAGSSTGILVEAGGNSLDYSLATYGFTGNPYLIVRGDGNVGVKTAIASISEALYVTGNILATGTVTAPTFAGALTGNASTATALQTARTISGTSFDGTANITLNNTGITNGAGYITSSALSPYAPLASPALTGTPTAPTATAGTNTTQVATTAYVDRLGGGTITRGRYDGLITAGTNVSGTSYTTNGTSYTTNGAHYTRIGDEVTVRGRASMTATAAGASAFYINLPVASNLVVGSDLLGDATADLNSTNVVIYADTTNDRATVEFTSAGNAFMTVYYSFTYTVLQSYNP